MRLQVQHPRALAAAAALLGALALSACQETPTAPPAANRVASATHRGPSFSITPPSGVVPNTDVTYGMLHGSFRLWNSAFTSTGNGTFDGDTAFVQPGASVGMKGNWQVGPVTNTGYCPGCIIEEYVAWVPPAAGNGATPFNAGLWMGQTYFTNPNPGPNGAYSWTTHAPTIEGVYMIGAGSTLDYVFQPGTQGGAGSPTSGPNTQPAASFMVVADGTAPTVAYTGNAGTYTVDQTVSITCTATDTLSGVASSTCANVSGPAYSFATGSNSYSAQATDRAGNVGTGSTTFTVSVTNASVCALVTGWDSQAGVAHSMCVKLAHGDYLPFLNELSAQSGKTISAANAAILKSLVSAL